MPENTEEILPVVNEEGKVIGKALREDCHFQENEKLLHPVVHVHLLNSKGEIFLQYRPAFKKVQPDKWDTAVGGHVSFGESIDTALERESIEEIGINPVGAVLLTSYIWETEVERELIYLYVLRADLDPQINESELAGGRYWNAIELEMNINREKFTPNLVHELSILKKRGIFN